MKVSLNTKMFTRQMNNIVDYSFGFLDGIDDGKTLFFNNLARGTIEALKLYIDAMARSNPESLHHVYEWYKTGSPDSRLFSINYTVNKLGIIIDSNFRQSQSIKNGSSEPFYNKAKIMENRTPVVIRPRGDNPLVFDDNGTTVYTKKPIINNFPGGKEVQGSYEKTFDDFMIRYFAQSFLTSTGLYDYLNNPLIYKKNLKAGSKGGRSVGKSTGFKWITNAKVEVE
jgi:hypothetical protein